MEKTIYTQVYKKIIERLIKAREDVGFTQIQVAKKLGKHQSFISKCETGERRIDIVELKVIAKIYKKPINFFLD